MTRQRLIAFAAVFVVVLAGGVWWWTGREPEPGAQAPVRGDTPTRPVVPKGIRIRVEVLNATDSRGLARQATFFLRDAGFDVVYFGNTTERSDSTIVRNRSGHAEWAALAARTMAPARVEQRPDSSHFLDLTVLVGRHWAPSRKAFYP
jgi:LytR cell envelope-related transcriptional attenuator